VKFRTSRRGAAGKIADEVELKSQVVDFFEQMSNMDASEICYVEFRHAKASLATSARRGSAY
jgi:hypothetical protein